MSRYKATLVLGNGFDLSLKLDTSYKSFYQHLKNTQFIDNNSSNNLIKKIEGCAEKENWYDFESIIREYSTSSNDARYLKRLCELKKIVNEIQQTQDVQKYNAEEFRDITAEFAKSSYTSLQNLNQFIANNTPLDFNKTDELTNLCGKALTNIDAIQKKYKKDADNIIKKLKEELQAFLKKAVLKQIMYEDNPGIRILLALLNIEYKGSAPAAKEIFSHYNEETKEYEFKDDVRIISFNYTDTFKPIVDMIGLSGRMGLRLNFNNLKNIYYPIHGTLKKEDLIFGTDDCENIPSEFLIFKKLIQMENRHVKDEFTEILKNSEFIVIFGHSINGIDYDYYKTFFQENAKTDIYIITYNEVSKEAIERTLRDNGVSMHISYLFTEHYSTAESSEFMPLLKKLIK